mmetsp:Transcript_52256/g.138544  ORF Transcript_52256/g.138544 Transcript_52256/m.138544 type:complete len:354 (+) Transcript_52256:108-1169(+)
MWISLVAAVSGFVLRRHGQPAPDVSEEARRLSKESAAQKAEDEKEIMGALGSADAVSSGTTPSSPEPVASSSPSGADAVEPSQSSTAKPSLDDAGVRADVTEDDLDAIDKATDGQVVTQAPVVTTTSAALAAEDSVDPADAKISADAPATVPTTAVPAAAQGNRSEANADLVAAEKDLEVIPQENVTIGKSSDSVTNVDPALAAAEKELTVTPEDKPTPATPSTNVTVAKATEDDLDLELDDKPEPVAANASVPVTTKTAATGVTGVALTDSDFNPVFSAILQSGGKSCPSLADSVAMVHSAVVARDLSVSAEWLSACVQRCGASGSQFPMKCCPNDCYAEEELAFLKCAKSC